MTMIDDVMCDDRPESLSVVRPEDNRWVLVMRNERYEEHW